MISTAHQSHQHSDSLLPAGMKKKVVVISNGNFQQRTFFPIRERRKSKFLALKKDKEILAHRLKATKDLDIQGCSNRHLYPS